MRKVTTANVNNTTYTDLSDWDRNTAEVNYGGFQGQSSYNGRSRRPFRDDDICKWCRNIQVDGMRPQPPHQYMNQCHDYKMFIGKGVIHEADETGRVCIGPWNPSKPAFPVQFSNDLPRRNQIIQRTINTIYSHIPERREQAIRENAEHERVARESRKPNVSSVESIEAFKDEEYDTTDLLEERELDEEQSAWVQEFIVNAVETRKSRRKAERDAPYTKETLQERLQKQGSYGRPKVLQSKTVTFDDKNDDYSLPPAERVMPKRILKRGGEDRHMTDVPAKPEDDLGRVVPRTPRSSTPKNKKALETLVKMGYSYEGALGKLLNQTSIPPGFTLGDMLSLVDPTQNQTKRSRTLKPGKIDRKIQDTLIDESEVGTLAFERDSVGNESSDIISERLMLDSGDQVQVIEVNMLLGETFSGYSDYHSPTPKVVVTITGRAKLSDVRATLDTGAEVSVITLDAATRFEIPITYSSGMALRTIVGNRSRFVGFADNVPVTIGNTVVRTRFYIMDCPGIKIILGFPFFRKARVTLRYPKDHEDGPVFALFHDPRTGVITTVKTNTATQRAKETLEAKSQNVVGMIQSDSESEIEDSYASNDSENE